ncbi:terminase [Salininema proteolyticum]|uniref:Terminase n=1 Tax=Salininema proteolyticum TaxID=1607685 RepID=A0ABV8TUK3_9ACTN
MVEFVGPSRVIGWHDGQPVGGPHPRAWVQIAAVSRDQTRNTMTLFPGLLSNKVIDRYGIKPGIELLRADSGKKRLEAVTSSYRALEGGRTTFALLNETHHWISGNAGDKMYETVDGNSTKTSSRYLAITNAFLPGEQSVAEQMREAHDLIAEGRAVEDGTLYDSVEADPRTPLTPEALREVIPKIRGDAEWLDVEAIIRSVVDTTISPARSRRMWLNQIVADDEAVYSPADWAAIEVDATLEPDDAIVIGFDGGRADDATGLVAIRVRDRCAFTLELWQAPEGPAGEGWTVDRDAVDTAVGAAFETFDVQAMYCDVALWESYIDTWAHQYGGKAAVKASPKHPFAWDMRASQKRNTIAHERLVRAVLDRKLSYDGDRALRRHALNARRRVNAWGMSFGKEARGSRRKVDLYAALMLAHEAWTDLSLRSISQHDRIGTVYFVLCYFQKKNL